MASSVHDNKLVSYTVNEKSKQITLETIFDERIPVERTNITFNGVAAYHFKDHSLSLGTIIFGIEESNPNFLIGQQWEVFEKGRAYGWPGPWGESKEKAADFFAKGKILGFQIDSSCGMNGWVLAERMEIKSISHKET